MPNWYDGLSRLIAIAFAATIGLAIFLILFIPALIIGFLDALWQTVTNRDGFVRNSGPMGMISRLLQWYYHLWLVGLTGRGGVTSLFFTPPSSASAERQIDRWKPW